MSDKIIVCSENASEPFYFSSLNLAACDVYEAMFLAREYSDTCAVELLSDEFSAWLSKVTNEKRDEFSRAGFISRCFGKYDYLEKNEIQRITESLIPKESGGKSAAYKEKGDMYYRKGDFINACSAYFSAFNEDETPELLNNIGLCMIAMEDIKTGITSLEQAALFLPDSDVIARNLARAYILNKEYMRALEALKNHSDRESRFLYAGICVSVDDITLAEDIYTELYEEIPEDRILYALCDIYISTRNYEKAWRTIEKAEESPSKTVAASRIYAEKRDFVQAIREIERNLMRYVGNAELWTALSKYYRQKGDFVKAEGAICKASTLDRGSVDIALEHARIKYSEGKYEQYRTKIEDILENLKVKYREKENFLVENI